MKSPGKRGGTFGHPPLELHLFDGLAVAVAAAAAARAGHQFLHGHTPRGEEEHRSVVVRVESYSIEYTPGPKKG